MEKILQGFAKGKPIYCGIDVHKLSWTINIRCMGEVIYRATIPPIDDGLMRLLKSFEASEVHTVYEAGPTGYWLHDELTKAGFHSIVTPPSKVPQVNERVKTDHRDGGKLSALLEGGFLRAIDIPTVQERAHRQLYRTRQQIMKHRRQTQNQIKSMLLWYGHEPLAARPREYWSQGYIRGIEELSWDSEELKASMDALLSLFHHLDNQVKELDKKLRALAETEQYRERIELLTSVRGIGSHTAIAMAVELRDATRFRKGSHFASYLGLTPSEHSSGQTKRKGEITHCGNPRLRELFVESSWTLIRYDPEMYLIYDQIKHRRNSKKAITAIARRLALRVRRMLIDKKPYQMQAPLVVVPVGVKRYVLKKQQLKYKPVP